MHFITCFLIFQLESFQLSQLESIQLESYHLFPSISVPLAYLIHMHPHTLSRFIFRADSLHIQTYDLSSTLRTSLLSLSPSTFQLPHSVPCIQTSHPSLYLLPYCIHTLSSVVHYKHFPSQQLFSGLIHTTLTHFSLCFQYILQHLTHTSTILTHQIITHQFPCWFTTHFTFLTIILPSSTRRSLLRYLVSFLHLLVYLTLRLRLLPQHLFTNLMIQLLNSVPLSSKVFTTPYFPASSLLPPHDHPHNPVSPTLHSFTRHYILPLLLTSCLLLHPTPFLFPSSTPILSPFLSLFSHLNSLFVLSLSSPLCYIHFTLFLHLSRPRSFPFLLLSSSFITRASVMHASSKQPQRFRPSSQKHSHLPPTPPLPPLPPSSGSAPLLPTSSSIPLNILLLNIDGLTEQK